MIIGIVGALALAAAAPRVGARIAQQPLVVQTRALAPDVTARSTSATDSVRRRTATELIAAYDGSENTVGVAERYRGRLKVVVVLLPDPIDSHMDWAYDSGLESIRRANEATGFVADRFWLPWPGTGDSVRLRAHPNARPVRDLFPGVLLFRPTSTTDSSLRVFLVVGETPAFGIRASQFDEAMAERDRLLSNAIPAAGSRCRDNDWSGKASTDGNVLRIVGPVTSGSSASLRRALERWRVRQKLPADACVAEIISGGATNAGNRAWFPAPSFSFHGTVHSDAVLQSALERYLAQLGIRPNEIAYLREGSSYGRGAALVDTTQFGAIAQLNLKLRRALRDSGNEARRQQRMDSILSEADTARRHDPKFHSLLRSLRADDGSTTAARRLQLLELAATGVTPERDSLPLSIRFPVNISRLRSEYARHPVTAEVPAGSAPGPRIPLNLVEAASTEEAPVVASDLTAPSLEFILAEMASALRAHRIKAVGVLASDVRDKMFLGDEMKRRMRDVQLFAFGSNVLLARQDFGSLRGMLVVSSYPLTLENQHWDLTVRDARERMPFLSDISEGTFNATLFQLDAGRLAQDYAVPLDTLRTTSPPVWISAVGKRIMLPILFDTTSILARPDSTSYLVASQTSELGSGGETPASRSAVPLVQPDVVPEYGFLTVFLIIGFFVTYAVAQYRIEARPRTALTGLGNESDPDVRRIAVHRQALMFRREVYALIRLAAIALTTFAVALFLMRSKTHGFLFDAWTVLVPALFLLVTIFAVSRAALPLYRLTRHGTVPLAQFSGQVIRENSMDGLAWISGIAARVLLVALAVLWLWAFGRLVGDVAHLRDAAPARAALFYLRATAIGSGLSPAWPLLLGGFGLMTWSVWHLRRVALLGRVTAFEYSCTHTVERSAVDDALLATRQPSRAESVSAGQSPPKERRHLLDRLHSDQSPRETPAADVRSVRRHLFFAVPGLRGAALLLFLVLFTVYQWQSFHRSFESGLFPAHRWLGLGPLTAYDVLYRTIILCAVVALAWALYRLLATWLNLRDLLRAIGTTPLLEAFRRSSESFSRLTRITPFDVPSDEVVDQEIKRKYGALRTLLMTSNADWFAGGTADTPVAYIQNHPEMPKVRVSLYDVDPTTFGDLLPGVLQALPVRWTSGGPPASDEITKSRDAITLGMEDLLVAFIVDYIEWVFSHLRAVAFFLALALPTTTALLWSYPFLPESGIRVAFIVLACLCVAALLFMLTEINRDVVLSRITHTDLGKVTWDSNFVSNLVIFGLLPILAILGAQFPAVGDLLFSWVTPAIRAVVKI
ncbi:MAG: hypothetical protein ABIP93_20450 [Gemmatimonadaceae bacterium]